MHTHTIRVYYEDTDLAGIVYYANYLKFIERGRTEALRAAGVDQMALRASDGVVFAVRRVEADFLAPARMDDLLDITTTVTKATGARIVMDQAVRRDGETLFEAVVTIVALQENGRPARIPGEVTAALEALVA